MNNCAYCNKEIKRPKWCSQECQNAFNNKRFKEERKPRKINCLICTSAFITDKPGPSKYCSSKCKIVARKARVKLLPKTDRAKEIKHEREHLRRKKYTSAFVQRVIRAHIYSRDGWRCQICKRKVDPRLSVPHPLAKTIDHIVPLARGGTHEPRNVRLAHFICNSKRGATQDQTQLRLY